MSDVDRLLAEYIERLTATGDADPLPYLERAGDDRLELAALIDAQLERAPRRRSPAAARNAADDAIVDELQRSIGGAGGVWPALLPRLRARAGLKRSELVARLADALNAREDADRVAGYYHRMEQGRLPSAGVSDTVLSALGALVGETADTLRAAGRPLAPPPPPRLRQAYARTTRADRPGTDDEIVAPAAAAAAAAAAAPAADAGATQRPDGDRIDGLFLRGED
jgi:hypothetical protein